MWARARTHDTWLSSANAAAVPMAVAEMPYRADARRVLATRIRLLGGFDAAEEALHDAFAVAAEQWPREGVPPSPYAWLVSTARFKTIDRWRRQAFHASPVAEGCNLAANHGCCSRTRRETRSKASSPKYKLVSSRRRERRR